MSKYFVAAAFVIIFGILLLIKRWAVKEILYDKPGCYGHRRVGDSRALCDCENCELEYECEQTATERWGEL